MGQHEAIVKNVHDLLAKLAWDFSPEQLDHLFECFQVRINLILNSLVNSANLLKNMLIISINVLAKLVDRKCQTKRKIARVDKTVS